MERVSFDRGAKDFDRFSRLYFVMSERFSYGALGVEQTAVVIDAYEQTRSCLRTSLIDGVYVSPATVSRVVQEAVTEGILEPTVKRRSGRPTADRKRITNLLVQYPAASDKELAPLAGVSQFTVARVRRGMEQ
ncbi:MAG: hypothetical protein A2785_03780 [Candidatus Chisholmbacteria bacterium RIFCSPHIGHO2_01_FULL_49_18]|uniref:Uncharacterized protein n=2 Tax=Candidatus Chisholmiibacteriota TaxID=1817900 RepID=A0A1G1VN79_9BACT|nr:MAG: hypothetical protein A2785_03780 [Candidatus Chisholmbacteria bacterium RIFCSPHIGHO2_01_FULL_49_18]OGY19448.1 MAG: hypothetical protein A3A65_06080 [Candidatus Chisholmbacteria bacterium RIFCSPLOWO2_01_FULL_49_14]